MAGRISQNMFSTSLLRYLNTNLNRMGSYQEQLSSNMRINRPSDDPVGISYSLRYRSELGANEQYKSNLASAQSFLEYTDTMLGQVGDVFHSVKELTIQGANSTNPQVSMNSIKNEISQLYEQLRTIGNSSFKGDFVFNGQFTDVEPYGQFPEQYDTDDGGLIFEIGQGILMSVNVTGNQVFGNSTDEDNAFTVLNDIMSALESGDPEAVGSCLANLDERFNKILEVRSMVGAKANRLDLAAERLDDIDTNLQTLQSKVEDADMAEVIINLKTSENVYQASLAVGAQIIRPSLIDFLR